MRRVVILVTEVVLPITVAIILAAVFRSVYVSEDGCNFLLAWILIGFPFGVGKLSRWLVPVHYDLAGTVGILFLNVLLGGLIGGVALVWQVVKGLIKFIIG